MVSKRSRGNLLGLIVLLIVNFALIGSLVYFRETVMPTRRVVIDVLIAFMVVVTFFLSRIALKIPRIEVLPEGLVVSFMNDIKKIGWSDISDINYHGKDGIMRTETVTVKTILSHKPVLIQYGFYSNTNELIQAIKYGVDAHKMGKKVDFANFVTTNALPVTEEEEYLESYRVVSRTPLLSEFGMFPLLGLWGIYKMFTSPHITTEGIVLLIVFMVLINFPVFLFIGKVGASARYLKISNYYIPYKRVFRLEDIQSVFIEPSANNRKNVLKVFFKDSKMKIFPIIGFLKKDWLELEGILTAKGIVVYNKLYPKK